MKFKNGDGVRIVLLRDDTHNYHVERGIVPVVGDTGIVVYCINGHRLAGGRKTNMYQVKIKDKGVKNLHIEGTWFSEDQLATNPPTMVQIPSVSSEPAFVGVYL